MTAPTPVLPRASAEQARLGRVVVEPGDRLLLLVRNALRRGRPTPDPHRPAPERLSQLAFGAGAHACPGAQLARAQLADTLAALAPLRPTVVRSRPARAHDVALPGWAVLVVGAGAGPVAPQREPSPNRSAP